MNKSPEEISHKIIKLATDLQTNENDVIIKMIAFYIIGVIVSLVLNILVITVVIRRGREANHLDLLMFSLAVSDVIRSGIGYPMEINAYYYTTPISEVSCTIAGFSITFLALVSISHMVGISIERCIIINFPWKARDWFTSRWVSLYIIIPSWIYGLIWSMLPLIGWSSYEREQGAKYRCSINVSGTSVNSRSYAYSILCFCFALPIICIVMSSLSTVRKMSNMRTQSMNMGMDAQNANVRRNQIVKHTAMIFAIITTFIISWSPYAACVLVMTVHGKVENTLLSFSAILAKTSTLYNPIIYAIFMKDFRTRCWLLFRCRTISSAPTSAVVVNMRAISEEPSEPTTESTRAS